MNAPSLNRRGLWSILRLDPVLLALLLALMAIGLMVLYSASEQDIGTVWRQLVRIGVGLMAMLVFAQLPPNFLKTWAPWLYGLVVLMLVAVAVIGVGRGAQRWLDLGVIRFQPSEAMKLALPIMIAALLAHRPLPPGWKELLATLALIAVPVALILGQPDLGTSILVALSGLCILFLAGLRWRVIIGMALATVAALPLLWFRLHDYQRNRVLTFLDPERDPLGTGWNIIQSKIAVGSGGLTGKGWTEGSQSHLEFLPEPHTDFIFSVLAEEFGFVGVIAVLALYAAILLRGLFLASRCRGSFGRLLAGSMVFMFFVYLAVNVGMVSGVLPVVGVPLPLVSYGGTSAATLLAGLGLVMGLHSRRRFMA
ncbi:rod shape-determining protein RodA [Wenzhouxiangella marina]|uniref:Peptidoglycan glycosyltransferase MrdB n=1 Tax=Wenzhouxiangella marina TaxID=1579979 RepID=A0A0K0XSD0_9GAMM|nr:rod shape-determining protein RodA [Wenzhouxiangella marina]AKS40619.1 rod shape-determining protein RodA [Wenzhouxiangella marina]MBB6088387.1 rod shape determining protein RodA [Wenzhouxiangella marina]